MRATARVVVVTALVSLAAVYLPAQSPAPKAPDLAPPARTALAQLDGTIMVYGLREPVEVLRDQWGIPHIYAKNTHDLFFAQGYVVAQDRMWQLEMWRRNGEGRLAEVLGEAYVTRDTFARLLTFRGNWDEEFRRYHPEGPVVFDAFARGVIRALQQTMPQLRETLGRVTVRIILNQNGNVESVQVVRPSKIASLDQSVLFATKQTSYPFPPPNATLADRTFVVTYIYH